MAKFCNCGRVSCPICKGKDASAILLDTRTSNVRRHKNVTQSVRPETPNVLRSDGDEKVLGEKLVEAVRGKPDACPTCGRPYCPECGEPIPVRGDYCKPACRSRAWRKKG